MATMRQCLLLLVCLMLVAETTWATKNPQLANSERADKNYLSIESEYSRIERLTGLAKVWGAVKYLHPFPAYREIDWDKALVEAIPRVNAARSRQDFLFAVNQMLSALDDKNTRAEFDPADERQMSLPADSSEPSLGRVFIRQIIDPP